MLDVAARMLVHDRAKFAITLAGVAFAVTLVFVQVGLLRALLANATVTIDNADADLWVTSKNTPNIDFPHYFPEATVSRIRGLQGVERADNLLVSFVGMQLPNGAEETVIVYGLEKPRVWNLPWAMAEGSADAIRRGKTMMLDDSAIRRFGRFVVGEHRELVGQRLDIVGRTKGALSFTTMPIAFTSLRVAQDLEPNLLASRTAYILVKTANGGDQRALMAEIKRRLPYNDVYTKAAWAERTRDYWLVSTGLGMNLALTVLLGVLVGVTVVAQTLYAATLDHTREFGTLKAMGATSSAICALVAGQAALAGVVGYLLALPFVALLRHGARSMDLDIVVSPAFAGWVFVGAVTLCVAASLLTFRRIAAIDPALVFRM
jgi:putative ABC transport system permease protein